MMSVLGGDRTGCPHGGTRPYLGLTWITDGTVVPFEVPI